MKNLRPRVLVADGHAMFAEALRTFLAKSHEVVAVVSEPTEILDAAAQHKPDVVVLDLGMMLPNGVTPCSLLKERYPSIKVICLTEPRNPSLAVEEFRKGASAFLLKNSTTTELLTAIQEVAKDRIYISPLIAKEIMSGLIDPLGRESREPHLTARQLEVLQLLAQGKSMKTAAEMLNISKRTVQFHKYELMKILHLRSTAEIIQYAIKRGMIAS